jgi:hypothetical protein
MFEQHEIYMKKENGILTIDTAAKVENYGQAKQYLNRLNKVLTSQGLKEKIIVSKTDADHAMMRSDLSSIDTSREKAPTIRSDPRLNKQRAAKNSPHLKTDVDLSTAEKEKIGLADIMEVQIRSSFTALVNDFDRSGFALNYPERMIQGVETMIPDVRKQIETFMTNYGVKPECTLLISNAKKVTDSIVKDAELLKNYRQHQIVFDLFRVTEVLDKYLETQKFINGTIKNQTQYPANEKIVASITRWRNYANFVYFAQWEEYMMAMKEELNRKDPSGQTYTAMQKLILEAQSTSSRQEGLSDLDNLEELRQTLGLQSSTGPAGSAFSGKKKTHMMKPVV